VHRHVPRESAGGSVDLLLFLVSHPTKIYCLQSTKGGHTFVVKLGRVGVNHDGRKGDEGLGDRLPAKRGTAADEGECFEQGIAAADQVGWREGRDPRDVLDVLAVAETLNDEALEQIKHLVLEPLDRAQRQQQRHHKRRQRRAPLLLDKLEDFFSECLFFFFFFFCVCFGGGGGGGSYKNKKKNKKMQKK